MPQKVLAGRSGDPQLRGDLIRVKVDQVILTRSPARAVAEGLRVGMKRALPEVTIAYEGYAVSDPCTLVAAANGAPDSVSSAFPEYNILVGRAGIGYPAPVHIERFAAPARLALTDDPRLATVGGLGMLALVVSPTQLGEAMATGQVWLRPPRSIQIHLSGKTRPFVCARDVALELIRRDLRALVQEVEARHHAPVVLEFAGPSARLLSVGSRSVLCGIAHQVGASAALFISDDKSEAFLRDQRRSKAHRALAPDPGAPCDEVITLDLNTVDPLIMDEDGRVRAARELAGKPVGQVVLGGDSGATLRDLLAAASLLKSKRIPPRLDLLLAPPSRQVLEVLGQDGALVDLVATGARIIEPDRRVATGDIYPAPLGAVSMRNMDPEPQVEGRRSFLVASAETLSYAVAHGQVGDPRSFKRPARVTVPRILPTEDVLVVRKKGQKKGPGHQPFKPTPLAQPQPLKLPLSLDAHPGLPQGGNKVPEAPSVALVLSKPEEVRAACDGVLAGTLKIRAIVAPAVPRQIVTALASEGVAAFQLSAAAVSAFGKQKDAKLAIPAKAWAADLEATLGKAQVTLRWLAVDREQAWTQAGRS
ncbi:MAG: 3-isopropylmalate dehydratase [Deltaproteobacteria bacterium]|nr:3-isopropylmalate dehydratase [Deltaproteobacteria bacterium]